VSKLLKFVETKLIKFANFFYLKERQEHLIFASQARNCRTDTKSVP